MAYTQTVATTRFDFVARVTAAVADIKAAWNRYQVYSTTLDELQSLSAHELNDLGLNKTMLRSVAYKAAYGRS